VSPKSISVSSIESNDEINKLILFFDIQFSDAKNPQSTEKRVGPILKDLGNRQNNNFLTLRGAMSSKGLHFLSVLP